MFKFNKSSGQASKLLLVLAVVVLVAVIIVYLVMRMAEKPAVPNKPETSTIPQPVYEQTLGHIRFIYESAIDEGSILRASEIVNQQYSYNTQDLYASPGAKFIKVTIGAQNMGTDKTGQNVWDMGNIYDSEGRNFAPLDYSVNSWLPKTNLCGAVLQPAFDPSPCTKIFEVSKLSKDLKIDVKTGKNNSALGGSGNTDSFLIDLIVK